MTPEQEAAAQTCLTECLGHIARGEHEGTIRSVFNSHLRAIAGTPLPWWAQEHFVRTEAALRIGRAAPGFADNVVGLTAIEYEKDLRMSALHSTGLSQVHDYVAGLLNSGAAPASVRGVLSDTVRWEAYSVVSVAPGAVAGSISRHELTLRLDIRADCGAADTAAARLLHQFLVQQMGRDGGQVLTADTLHDMLGADSTAGAGFSASCGDVVDAAFAANPDYASMAQHLWANFVSFIGTTTAGVFDRNAYVDELYLLTLAKLIAANVLAGRALVSSLNELQAILDGRHFGAQGLTNLVEYDYFGWLTRAPHVTALVDVARDIQGALQAFDFSAVRPQDLFGRLVAQMAERTQRVLLGQEPTPAWLVSHVVDALDARQPEGQPRRYVDPCCGSGAFVVDVVARRASVAGFAGLPRETRGQMLCEVIAGFDIDPLAVMLAKVSWLTAARPFLHDFDTSFPLSIPIYHADSLFATTPLSGRVAVAATGNFTLQLDTHLVTLPRLLTQPSLHAFFDEYSEGLYAAALREARTAAGAVNAATVSAIRLHAERVSSTTLDVADVTPVEAFGLQFAAAMTDLERRERNGLWLYMLRNGYRPAMVKGSYNGVVTNFPWLALSKLADNPYKETLQELTTDFNLQPPADCAHHLELATIFFLHAARHYLGESGAISAVVPSSVIQGAHHSALRAERFRLPPSNLSLHIQEAWTVDREAFSTNVGAVLVAAKPAGATPLIGRHADPGGVTTVPLHFSTLGERNAWTRFPIAAEGTAYYRAQQGADVMPRTTWFHELTRTAGPGGAPFVQVDPIIAGASTRTYLISLGKAAKGFACTPGRRLAVEWLFPVLTSALCVQFHTNEPADAVLPLRPRDANRRLALAALGADRTAAAHFDEVFSELDRVWPQATPWDSPSLFHKKLNYRNKLTAQRFTAGQRLVLFGAGGTYPCASPFLVTPSVADRLIVDQTIYWFVVADDDEQDYVTGMVNSDALAAAIQPFQPIGSFGERHIHKLAVRVLPQWNPTALEHQAVVQSVRAIRAELMAAAAAKARLRAALTVPTSSLSTRRRAVRQHLRRLPSHAAYQDACWAVLPSAE